MAVTEIAGTFFIFVGVLFSGLAIVGILRLPDTYSRLHASGKISTLGVAFICLGTAFIIPGAILKLLALVIFIIFSGPVGSHAIAAAVHRRVAIHNEEAQAAGKAIPVEVSGVHRLEDLRRALEEQKE